MTAIVARAGSPIPFQSYAWRANAYGWSSANMANGYRIDAASVSSDCASRVAIARSGPSTATSSA